MMYADTGFGLSAYSPPVFDLSSFSSSPAAAAAAPDDAIYDHLVIGNMGQPSLISKYDLGGEGDPFKALEPIIEEPLLSLDPVVAPISMMSCGDNAMDDTIKVSDMGLSEVLHECEKEVKEKSAIEEMISELLDVIPMQQVGKVPRELGASPSAGECSLEESVSSGCLNSADRMNGLVRPNFLDFQGLDFEAAFGLRKAYSEGNISQEKWGNMGQPSLISEYDIGEGDLFKAPEPIIEEPLLSLDPVLAPISMMSCCHNAMDDTIKVSDVGLCEVLHECEKKLTEKSAIEETISELLDVIPMLQVGKVPGELRASPSAGEYSLQNSVSSGCLNSANQMNGSLRQTFLDFQGLNFEEAFGLRKAYSEGNISQEKWNLGTNTPRFVTIGDLKSEERKQKLSRYRMKKIKRNFGRKIKYACRKSLADSQPRIRGRFTKMHHGDMLKPMK